MLPPPALICAANPEEQLPGSDWPALVRSSDVRPLGTGEALDGASTSLTLAGGRRVIVLRTMHPDPANPLEFLGGSLSIGTFGSPMQPLASLNGLASVVACPSGVSWQGQPFLYFETVRSGGPSFQRVMLAADGTPAQPEELPPLAGNTRLICWPRVRRCHDQLAVAFRDGESHPMLALSSDGIHFSPPVPVGSPGKVAMSDVGPLGEHGFAYTFQTHPPGELTVPWVQVSSDGLRWSEPTRVSRLTPNIHDTSMLARSDGSLDLYYVSPTYPGGFTVFRRNLAVGGSVGPEQRVSDGSIADVMKPTACHLADGRVLLTFDQGTKRAGTEVVTEREAAVVLPGDAPTR